MWNYIDLFWLVINPLVVAASMSNEPLVPDEWITILAAMLSFAMLLNAYNWLRLFDGTAFYILLLRETIKDIKYFMVLFILSLFMFGIPMEILNNNNDENEVVESLFKDLMIFNVSIN